MWRESILLYLIQVNQEIANLQVAPKYFPSPSKESNNSQQYKKALKVLITLPKGIKINSTLILANKNQPDSLIIIHSNLIHYQWARNQKHRIQRVYLFLNLIIFSIVTMPIIKVNLKIKLICSTKWKVGRNMIHRKQIKC